MNQARLSLPVNILYNALQFFINYFTFVKLIELISFTYQQPKFMSKREDLISNEFPRSVA
ncbi:hypothetical protein [Nostoc sp. FACHB-133]|uniref:hypothetical protein n=1 Tax=Nostoc sp. FACHB-133 TaxID=2692835 RepID=UPI0016880F4E|nr:hypothetical protein [Nostoc sp. FACHB-133]MBD2525096.1 hypothetical protein [Nostoc sp. FACHB-133]